MQLFWEVDSIKREKKKKKKRNRWRQRKGTGNTSYRNRRWPDMLPKVKGMESGVSYRPGRQLHLQLKL